ncbi:MAG: acyltransferase family protein, partial [Pseudomonadota bacterium]
MNQTRRHDIDAVRALAFGLLILYHVGMFYVSWGWHVKSGYPAPWLEPFMSFVNQWRMPLIFVVSGLAVHFMLRDGAALAPVLGKRLFRLGVPLLFGMAVVVPPQAYVEALANGAVAPGYGAFLLRYFGFADWPDGAFAGSDIGITWNHLWYLPYLLLYTLVALPLLRLEPAARAVAWYRRQPLPLVLLLPVALLLPAGVWLFPRFPYISHDLATDFYAHAMYGTFFVAGFALGRDGDLWTRLARGRYVLLGIAIVAYLGLRAVGDWQTETAPERALQSFVVYLNRWCWILTLLAFGYRLLNRPLTWLGYANRAVYPWYVLHQTFTVVGGYWLGRLALGPVAEPVLLIDGEHIPAGRAHEFDRVGRAQNRPGVEKK